MIIRQRKDPFIAEIVPNVPPETHRQPPVAAATGQPDICQISPALLLRPPLFHILKNCCCCCCSSSSSMNSSSSSMSSSSRGGGGGLILLLHLYLLAFFKFFSKLNIIFFSTIQYLSLLYYNTQCNTVHNNRFRCVPK